MYKYFNETEDPKMIGVSEKLMTMLDNARSIAKIPFIITSGKRTQEENLKAGGVIDSSHLYGLAVDLRCSNSSDRYRIISSLLVAGFKRLEIGKEHIHIDIDTMKSQEVMWIE